MCTLTIAHRVFPGVPVAVAANRDELLDRPSTPPRASGDDPAVLAPRDEEAGGTWIGVNSGGLLVAITNRWVDGLAGERSRGLLVSDALHEFDAASAVRHVQDALGSHEYEGFNLLVADADAAVLLEWDGDLRVTDLDPGVHVVMNAGYDDRFEAFDGFDDAVERQIESATLVREALAPRDDEDATAWLDRAAEVLGDHEYGVCVHEGEFGTRSSSLVAVSDDGGTSYRFADGPPCRTEYRPVEDQI